MPARARVYVHVFSLCRISGTHHVFPALFLLEPDVTGGHCATVATSRGRRRQFLYLLTTVDDLISKRVSVTDRRTNAMTTLFFPRLELPTLVSFFFSHLIIRAIANDNCHVKKVDHVIAKSIEDFIKFDVYFRYGEKVWAGTSYATFDDEILQLLFFLSFYQMRSLRGTNARQWGKVRHEKTKKEEQRSITSSKEKVSSRRGRRRRWC